MKIPFLLIITSFLAVLVVVEPLNQLNAQAQSTNSTVQYLPLQGSKLEVTVRAGQSADLPVKISVPPGGSIINLWITLSPWTDGIYGTVSPQITQNVHAGNATLRIYAQPFVKPGNYTTNIVAQGWVNDTSGKAFMVNSEPPTPFPIKVLPYNGTVSLKVGNMTDIKRKTFCYNNGCSGFTSTEKFQVLLQSKVNTTVSLDAPDIPQNKWVHFDPAQVSVGPSGAQTTMTIAGMVQSLTGNNPVSTRIFTVKAESPDGSAAQVFFPYENNLNMSVLRGPGPVNFTQKIITNISRDNADIYAVVYDPGNNGSLPVTLSVAGIKQENHIVPLPPSIDVKINRTSFVLNSSQIYYIPVMIRTTNASVGDHFVAINETVGGKNFISILPFYVMPNICTGGPGMCGPQPTPEEKEKRTNLEFPFDVTTDSQGNIYVADSSDDRIVKFGTSGNYMMQFGTSGRGNGQFMDPRGVAVDGSGDIYVADTTNNRIEKFDPSGKFLLKFGSDGTGKGEFHGPYDIAVDKSGNVYVGDVGNARVQKFDPDGNFILEFGSRGRGNGQFDDLGRIAVDKSGYVYVTDVLQGIEKFDSKGDYISNIQLKATLSGNNAPDAYGIALDNKGGIFVAGDNQARIQKFDSNGTFQYEFGSFGKSQGQFNHPGNIALDSSGNILVADSDNNRIERLGPHGQFLSEIRHWNSTAVKNQANSFESPLVQARSGIAPRDVKCEAGLQLVIKAEDGSPACVNPASISKLVQWGWASKV